MKSRILPALSFAVCFVAIAFAVQAHHGAAFATATVVAAAAGFAFVHLLGALFDEMSGYQTTNRNNANIQWAACAFAVFMISLISAMTSVNGAFSLLLFRYGELALAGGGFVIQLSCFFDDRLACFLDERVKANRTPN